MMQGRRVDNSEPGALWLEPGDYGKDWQGTWMCVPPGTDLLGNLSAHEIVEHEDGTITVSPSIEIGRGSKTTGWWHGFLEAGVWRQAA